MTLTFRQETFRDDYSFCNSPAAIARFPFPFPQDQYMYSVNIEPHRPTAPGSVYEHAFDVDEHYVAECAERDLTLATGKGRYAALPHMMDAQWDTLELLMTSLADDYPDLFSLHREGRNWRWVNRPLAIAQDFVFGDASTLPMEPLEYITRQAQGDFVLLDQREGNLWADAGMVTAQADWSLRFDAGMHFDELRRAFPELVLMGNVSADLLVRGTVEQVRARTLACIEQAAPRMIVASANAVLHGTPIENVLAMHDVVRQYAIPVSGAR